MSKRIEVYDKCGKSTVKPLHEPPAVDYEKISRDHENAQREFMDWLDKLDQEIELYQSRMRKAIIVLILWVGAIIALAVWSSARADTVGNMLSAAAGITAGQNLCGHTATEMQQAILDMAEVLIGVPENLELLKGEMLMHIVREDEMGNEEYCRLSRAALDHAGS